MRAPDNILLSFNSTFYVTEAPIVTQKGKYKGRSLVIGIAFLRYLNHDEFKSIISHEMGHFTGKDTTFSVYVSPLYKSIRRIMGVLDQYRESIAKYVPMLPLICLLKLFYKWYAKLEAKISRQREMRADYISTLLYGEQNFRSALTKVVNFSTIFSNVYTEHYVAILKEDKIFENYFSFFASILNTKILNDENFINDSSNDFSSHCSTKHRFVYIPKIKKNKESTPYKYEQYSKIEEELTEAMGRYIAMDIEVLQKQIAVKTNLSN